MQFKLELKSFLTQLNSSDEDNNNDKNDKKDKKGNVGVIFDLPPNIPQSMIVFGKKSINFAIKQAILIKRKYIDSNQATFEINISGTSRDSISNHFEQIANDFHHPRNVQTQKLNAKEILNIIRVFDDAIYEICDVLDGCFMRFHARTYR